MKKDKIIYAPLIALIIGVLIIALSVNVVFAAFTSHYRGVSGAITVNSIGTTQFSITTSEKVYPGYSGNIAIEIKYQGNMPVLIQNITLDDINVKYPPEFDKDATGGSNFLPATNGEFITLTIKPRAGSFSSGNGRAGWYNIGGKLRYHTDESITAWECVVNTATKIPTIKYLKKVENNTTLPKFTCLLEIKAPPTGDIINSAIDGDGYYGTPVSGLYDGCKYIKFDFSLECKQA